MLNDTLWSESDCARWHEAIDSYPQVILSFDDAKLVTIDAWFRDELPKAIHLRTPWALESPELVRVTEWKMRRGVWRARNLVLVKSNSDEAVIAASREAFAAAPDPVKPLRILSELAGVGPATASAPLSAAFPERYPFMDDVVAGQMPGMDSLKFTMREYRAYADALIDRARELTGSCRHQTWTAQDVGMALFAAAGGRKLEPS